jgi:hypothetical protein
LIFDAPPDHWPIEWGLDGFACLPNKAILVPQGIPRTATVIKPSPFRQFLYFKS